MLQVVHQSFHNMAKFLNHEKGQDSIKDQHQTSVTDKHARLFNDRDQGQGYKQESEVLRLSSLAGPLLTSWYEAGLSRRWSIPSSHHLLHRDHCQCVDF